MIQRAHFVTDKEEIIHLWQQCFDDSRDYVEFFLKESPKQNALFLYRNDKAEAVGMMLLMPGRIVAEGIMRKAYYLYALCVDERFRGRGIAEELLGFAKKSAKDENAELCLVPSSEKLRRYYAKRGFIDAFARTEQELDVNKTEMYAGKLKTEEPDTGLLLQTRTEVYNDNAFLWEKDNLEFAIKEHVFSGGFAFHVSEEGKNVKENALELAYCNGVPYIIGSVDENVLQIRETNLRLPVIYKLAAEYNCEKIVFLNIREAFENMSVRTSPYAMFADTAFVEKFVKSITFDKRYINFCFD